MKKNTIFAPANQCSVSLQTAPVRPANSPCQTSKQPLSDPQTAPVKPPNSPCQTTKQPLSADRERLMSELLNS